MAGSALTTPFCYTTPHSATLLCVEEQEQPENAHQYGKKVSHQPRVKSSRIHGCFRDSDPEANDSETEVLMVYFLHDEMLGRRHFHVTAGRGMKEQEGCPGCRHCGEQESRPQGKQFPPRAQKFHCAESQQKERKSLCCRTCALLVIT